MAKVSNIMATKVALDMVEASTSVRNLTTVVNSATQAWKANEANMRSAGDYAGAAKAKYEGLGNAISAQRDKIEALERKQSEMNNVDQKTADQYLELRSKLNEYREEMDKLDTTTEKGQARYKELNEAITRTKQQLDSLDTGTVKSAEQFLKYGQEVDRAKAKLASLESQQQRAAQQVDLENSGIIRLNATMRAQGALASATAERLRSEGQNYQAMTVEINNLRSRLDTLRTVQRSEVQLLDSTRLRMGETSTEYLKQAARVQDLGTKIQNTRSQINQLNETMRRTPTGWLGNLSARLDSISGQANRVSTTFGRIFGATAAANLFTNALGSISARMGDLIRAGVGYNIEQNKMLSTWTTLTGSAGKADLMIGSINKMAQATGQNVDVVNELEQGFYHLNSSKSQADGMTSSLLNMADAVGLNGDQIKAVEQDMVHGMATGKITQGELNQIGQYFPMLDEAMAKHFHTSVAGMRQMAKAGKITSKDLQDVFEQLGNGKYKKAAENMMNSYFGVFRTIRARTPQLIGDITKPFMRISNPFLQSVRKWINDKSTDTEFQRLGNQMARSMNQIIKAFGGNNVSATKLMDNAIRGLTNGAREFGNVVANHHTEIANFFRAFKTGSAAQAKLFVAVFADLSKILLPVLNLMARFPKTSAALITSMILASRAVRTLQAGIKGFETLKIASQAIQSFSRRLRGIPDKKTTSVNAETSNAQTRMNLYHRSVDRVPKQKSTRVTAETTQANQRLNSVKRQAQRVPKNVNVRATANTAQATTNLTRLGARSMSSGTNAMRGMTLVARGATVARAGLSLVGGPAGALSLVVMGFQALYQHNAKFRRFCNSIAAGARRMAGKVGRWFGNMARTAGRHISAMARSWRRGHQNMERQQQRSSRQQQRTSSQKWNRLGRNTQRGLSNISRHQQQAILRQNRLQLQASRRQLAQHRTTSSRIALFNSNMWKNILGTSTNGTASHLQIHKNGLASISGAWTSMWSSLRDFFGKIWDAIKNFAEDGMNAVISVINGGIGAIDTVWNFFTGHGSGIGKLGKVHFAQGGVVHRSLSVVNDGPGSNWKELMQFPDGSWGMSQQRNATLMLPVGTRVYSGEETKGIMNAAGVEHYAQGGVVGAQHFAGGGFVRALENWIGHFGDAIGGLGEKFRSMEDFLEEPIQKIKGVVQNAVGGDYGGIGHWGELAHGEWNKITDNMEHWVRHTITDFLYSFENKALSQDMMRAAATINKLKPSDGFFNMLWQVIMSESGGRNIVQQVHDVNSGGNEAAGILQYTPGTFAKYALPGHGERMNDFNQLLAFFNNTDWLASIGSTIIRGVQKIDWLHSGPQGGRRDSFWPHFAEGGLATQPSIFGEAGAEMAIPLDSMKSSRAWQLMKQVVNYYAGASETTVQSDPTDLTKLERKFDALLAQNQTMLSLIDKLIGVTDSANNPTRRYRREARDISLAQAQSFRN